MRTRSRADDSCSALRMVERVFALSTTEPTALVLRRTELGPDQGEGLPDGPILLPVLRGLLLSAAVPQETRDSVWRVLILRARGDGPAWLVAAVGMALPGLRRQVAVLAGSFAGAREDLESAVVEGFVTELGRVDVTRRGLCGRLVRAGYRAGLRQVHQDAPFAGAAGTGFASQAPRAPWGHPDFVLADAVGSGVLSQDEAWLIGVTRLEDVPVDRVAAELGQLTNTVVARRRRAEHRLRDAIVQGRAGQAQHQAGEPDRPGPVDPAAAAAGPRQRPRPACDAVVARVSPPACHPGLTRPPSRVGDLDAVRVESPIARGADGSAGRGHASPSPHPGKENGSPPSTPRAITPTVRATPPRGAPRGGDPGMKHPIPQPLPHRGRPLSRGTQRGDGVRRARRRSAGLLLLLAVCVLAVVLLWAAPAYAAAPGADPATARLETILANATAWLVGILAALATLFLTIGGIRYVMAGGDPGEVEKAKGAFKSAGLGYALAALAPLVVSIIKGILGV
jgi:hypothetical protein